MGRKIFISYRYHESEVVRTIKSFFQPGGGTCHGEPVFCTQDLSEKGDDAVDDEIRKVMKPCGALLIVVGDDSHNSPWMEREIKIALSRDLPMLGVRLPQTYGAPPNYVEEILKKNPVEMVEWKPSSLCPALNALPVKSTSS